MSRSPRDVLQYLAEAGIIDLDAVEQNMKEKDKIEQLSELHPYKIPDKAGPDGRWRAWVKDEGRKNNRKKITAATKEALIDKMLDHYKIKNEARTLENTFEEWLAYKQETDNIKDATVTMYRSYWGRWYKDEAITKIPLAELEGATIKKWLEKKIISERFDRQHYTECRSVIYQILDYAAAEGYIEKTPLDGIRIRTKKIQKNQGQKREGQVFTDDEVRKLKIEAHEDFTAGRQKKHYNAPLAIIFMLDSGLRVGEVVALKWIDVGSKTVTVRRQFSNAAGKVEEKTKGNYGPREVVITEEMQMILNAAKARQEGRECEFVFAMKEPTRGLYAVIRQMFFKYCDRAKITKRSSHKARKTYASALIDSHEVSTDAVRGYLGHADERTTLQNYHYARTTIDEERKQIENALAGASVPNLDWMYPERRK